MNIYPIIVVTFIIEILYTKCNYYYRNRRRGKNSKVCPIIVVSFACEFHTLNVTNIMESRQ